MSQYQEVREAEKTGENRKKHGRMREMSPFSSLALKAAGLHIIVGAINGEWENDKES